MSIDIKLEAFEGPLDLLLHLITREEVDIYDIPIVSITSQFIAAIGDIDQIDLEVATEFIVMASTLLEIKSKMLLPDKNELEVFDYNYDDPRQELVKRLVEYKRYKDIANLLREAEGTLDEVIFREQDNLEKYVAHVPKETLNESMDSVLLLEAVKRLLLKMNRFDENRQQYFKGIKRDLYTVDEKISLVRARLSTEENFEFSSLFGELITKEEVVVTFLALLELLKLKEVKIAQNMLFGEIVIEKRYYEDETHDIVNEGQDHYDVSK